MARIGFILNKDNLEFNLEKLDRKNNIIYVTGLSGSGKTTIAQALAKKYDATLFELDNLGGFFKEYKESRELIHNLTKEFLDSNLVLKEIIKADKYINLKIEHFEEYVMWTNKYIHFLEDYAHKDSKLYVFEGTQLFKCMEPQHFMDKPFIMIRTSAISSCFRRMKRQYRIDKLKKKPHFFRKHFWKLLNDSKRLHIKDWFYVNQFMQIYKNLLQINENRR